MYEFDSVSVSSFEAGSLTATLTEKSADGWDVVAIVTAGSDVVAYLKRATATAAADSSDDDVTVADVAADTAVAGTASDLLATQADSPAETSAPADGGGTGWASSAASAAPAAQGWNTDSSAASTAAAASTPAATSEPAASSGWGSSSTGSTGSWSGSSQQAATTQPAATPQVPAGWYADPAGRFELRYWDGGAWTEHVSRAGQQYTDPPVA